MYIYLQQESANKMRIPFTTCSFQFKFEDSADNLRILLTVADQLELILLILKSYYSFLDSRTCSEFCKHCCRLPKLAYFWSDFELYSVSSSCL